MKQITRGHPGLLGYLPSPETAKWPQASSLVSSDRFSLQEREGEHRNNPITTHQQPKKTNESIFMKRQIGLQSIHNKSLNFISYKLNFRSFIKSLAHGSISFVYFLCSSGKISPSPTSSMTKAKRKNLWQQSPPHPWSNFKTLDDSFRYGVYTKIFSQLKKHQTSKSPLESPINLVEWPKKFLMDMFFQQCWANSYV